MENAQTVSDVLKATVMVTALMAPASFKSLFLIIQMLNYLQIVIHLPLISVPVAANMFMVQKLMLKLVTYDLISEERQEELQHMIFGRQIIDSDNEEIELNIPGQI